MTTDNAMIRGYASRYTRDNTSAVYPVEFVVRAFLGTYPDLRMPRDQYKGRRVLDLGYGDGRNMPLLDDLGMSVHGVEIADDINLHVQERMKALGIRAELRLGTNAHIPFDSGYFQYALACHSCYYVETGDQFSDNLVEVARVLEPGGHFIASLPMMGSYILKGAKPLPGGHYEIGNDPYGLRNGAVFRVFRSQEEIRTAFSPLFCDLDIGFSDDMFWGIHQKVWILVCRKKGGQA